ncbi:MAG: chromosomal replication initiator protein DnaA, partial [Anaerolineae bacterium]
GRNGGLTSAANGDTLLGTSLKLRPNYTFKRFVVGSSNRLAHAASQAVSERPGKAYNPLFLYGGVGLGKTHLLQAIAHHALVNSGRVIYVSSETFTNDFINAIRQQTTDTFREHYRNTNFLLIDDIQFIAGKESTQEEFFHTFNDIHSAGGQIVLTSDRLPKAIPTLEDRLSSRFEWGLLADIQPPDLETRLAILRFKAEEIGARVSNEVMEFIARRAQNNIRELEGALNKVVAHAALTKEAITLSQAKQALQNLVNRRASITVDMVIEAVAQFYDLTMDELRGTNRSKRVAAPRHIAMYLAREETKASLPQIGEALGGRDHTTIMYGYGKINTLVEQNERIRRDAMQLREILYQNVA